MILHVDEHFLISFGEKAESFPPKSLYGVADDAALLATQPFRRAARVMGLCRAAVLKQTHSAVGYAIKSYKDLDCFKPYALEGDYLITALHGVGLAVATADCLPVIAYDPHARAVGIVHAGRAGSLSGIVVEMLDNFRNTYGTNPADLRVFFGPSARSCCYEIGDDCSAQIAATGHDPECKTLARRDGKTYFDLPLFNRLLLERAGVRPESIDLRYNLCTVCTPSFCSYRRDGERAYRQMTVAALK